MLAFLGLSDTGEGAFIGVVGAVLTLLISQGWSYAQSRAERSARFEERKAELEARSQELTAERAEWYRRTLFEKRLQAVTEAYGWAMQINRLVNNVGSVPKDKRDEAKVNELIETSRKGREWYNANAVYLNDDFPNSSNFIYILNAATDVLRPDGRFDWGNFNDLLKELRSRASELLAAGKH